MAFNERDPPLIVVGCDLYTRAAKPFLTTARREQERTVGQQRGSRVVGRAAGGRA